MEKKFNTGRLSFSLFYPKAHAERFEPEASPCPSALLLLVGIPCALQGASRNPNSGWLLVPVVPSRLNAVCNSLHFCASAVMVILNSKRPSESSSTEGSDSPSDEDKNRFYKQPSGPRQASASSSSESDTEESSGDGEPHASGVSQPKKAPQAKVRDPSPSVKAKKDSKRNREDAGCQEQTPAKRKNTSKKTDKGKKPSPPLQRETLPKGTTEKTPAKSVKEKKSRGSAGKDEKTPSRQQIVQEAAASTPGKKAQHVWSDNDEMAFANALLASSKRGIDVAKNLPQIHQDLKDSMEYEYTKGQLYEKLRRLKNKYNATAEKLKEANANEDSFSFKTPHEKSIYRICKQLWYEDQEMAEEAPPKDAGRPANPEVPLQEGDANDDAAGDSGDEEDDQEDGDHTVRAEENGKVSRSSNGSAAVQQDDKMALINALSELRNDCMKMIETSEARTFTLIEKQLKSVGENLRRGDGGIRASPAFSIINRDLMDGILAAGEFPLLDGSQAERLEQKWREQNIVEMEAFSRRLDLLQEECKIYLAGLKSPTGSGRP